MSQYFSATYLCQVEDCGARFGEIILRSERGQSRPCPKCGADAPETVGSPKVLQATYPTGHKRRGFEDAVKAAELEVQAIDYDTFDPRRAEIQKEIDDRMKVKD